MPAMDQKALAEIKDLEAKGKYDDPRYEELLMAHFYVDHILRMPQDQWPDPVLRAPSTRSTKRIYVPMQGPSEMGASGKLVDWDRTADLPKDHRAHACHRCALRHVMEPCADGENREVGQKGTLFVLSEGGSHLAIYDDQQVYMAGLTQFILDVNAGRF